MISREANAKPSKLSPRPQPRASHPTGPGAGSIAAAFALVTLAAAALAITGCSNQIQAVIPHAAWIERSGHREAIEGTDSTIARLAWPEFVGARTPEALDSLKLAVNTLLLAPTGRLRSPAVEPDSLMDSFIADWNEQRKVTHSRAYWRFDRQVRVMAETLGVVSLERTESVYTGGAHSMTTTKLVNLDADRGTTLHFDDFFHPEMRDSLDLTLEPMFRMTRGIAPDSSLREAGFTFPDDRFHVNDNFAVTRGGVLWHFDPYEIAPYAMGPTDFVVPFSALRKFRREEGPLATARR